jgi:hypothetical protein
MFISLFIICVWGLHGQRVYGVCWNMQRIAILLRYRIKSLIPKMTKVSIPHYHYASWIHKKKSLQNYDINGGINATIYSEFLRGNYWNNEMLKVDYDSVTFDVEDYIIGTCMTSTTSSECQNIKRIKATSFVNRGGIFKCFSLSPISELPLNDVLIALNNSIFPNGIRPSSGRFLLSFHYPHQIIRSSTTMYSDWMSRNNETVDYYVLNFHIISIEIIKRRKNGDEACYPWKNYDNTVKEDVMRSVGCRPPYWKSRYEHRLCNSKMELSDIINQYSMKVYQDSKFQPYIPPCIEMKKIEVQNSEISGKESKNSFNKDIHEKVIGNSGSNNTNLFLIHALFWKVSDFKEIRQIKAYSLQTMIGNAGGYIGLLVSVTISELPKILQKNILHGKTNSCL